MPAFAASQDEPSYKDNRSTFHALTNGDPCFTSGALGCGVEMLMAEGAESSQFYRDLFMSDTFPSSFILSQNGM